MVTPDYENYSLVELKEARKLINEEKFADRVQTIDALIAQQEEQVAQVTRGQFEADSVDEAEQVLQQREQLEAEALLEQPLVTTFRSFATYFVLLALIVGMFSIVTGITPSTLGIAILVGAVMGACNRFINDNKRFFTRSEQKKAIIGFTLIAAFILISLQTLASLLGANNTINLPVMILSAVINGLLIWLLVVIRRSWAKRNQLLID